MKKLVVAITFLFLILLALMVAAWNLKTTNTDPVRVVISPGETLSHKALQWEKAGWLPSASLLKLQAKYLKREHLRAGEFDIPPQLTGEQLLIALANLPPVTYRITLVEGTRLIDALARISHAPKLKQDMDLTPEAVAELIDWQGNPEGWLYPDTYVYQAGETVSDLIEQAHQRMQKELIRAWGNRDEGLPYDTPYEALIMASIVEKETAVPSERPEIAGVFVRRIKQRMRLETDPTVIYGLGPEFDGNLKKKHLLDRSNPYNTYRIRGLPPTPIALAGREALEAALGPAEGSALFFVARGDGTHVFSDTLTEHNRAVRDYQLRRRSDYRSTPQ